MKVETIEDLKNLVGKKVYLGKRIAWNNNNDDFVIFKLEVGSLTIAHRIYKDTSSNIEIFVEPIEWELHGPILIDFVWLTCDEALDFIKEHERED